LLCGRPEIIIRAAQQTLLLKFSGTLPAYIHNEYFDGVMKTPSFFGSFPNLESLRRDFLYLRVTNGMPHLLKLPRKVLLGVGVDGHTSAEINLNGIRW